MDIKKFAVEETAVLELKDASDQPMLGDDGQPMTITLYGPGSKTYARANAKHTNKLINKLRKKGNVDESEEQKAAFQAELLVACTKEFSPNIKYDDLQGEALYKALYTDARLGFVAEQAGKFIAEWGNFTKASTTS